MSATASDRARAGAGPGSGGAAARRLRCRGRARLGGALRSGSPPLPFIISPEDAATLGDLKTFTRGLMRDVETDLGTRLDWMVVDHWNNGQIRMSTS